MFEEEEPKKIKSLDVDELSVEEIELIEEEVDYSTLA